MKPSNVIWCVMMVATTFWAQAGDFTVDARLSRTNVFNRFVRITQKLSPEASARFVQTALNGMGLTGELNNYRMGLQGVYHVSLWDQVLRLDPFVGASYSNSDLVGGSLSGDLGLDARFKLLGWLDPVAGADVQVFSDSYLLDYCAGFTLPIIEGFSLDLLYSAFLTNQLHQTGFGGRFKLSF